MTSLPLRPSAGAEWVMLRDEVDMISSDVSGSTLSQLNKRIIPFIVICYFVANLGFVE
ncbi:hypothetical protein [Pantoea dispersa]|uniref:hypothetical protein n=1 Tax=Pantoea dispersa TaxID=59814 RepID=UPI00187B189A|nr:hypothetical protein [Pantoea dispersa]